MRWMRLRTVNKNYCHNALLSDIIIDIDSIQSIERCDELHCINFVIKGNPDNNLCYYDDDKNITDVMYNTYKHLQDKNDYWT